MSSTKKKEPEEGEVILGSTKKKHKRSKKKNLKDNIIDVAKLVQNNMHLFTEIAKTENKGEENDSQN